MRTTLKRGIGRGAAFTENGHAVLPPGTLTPVTFYRQPQPPARTGLGWVGRILLWTLLAIVSVVAAIAGGAYLYFHQSVAAVRAHSTDVKIAQKELDVAPAGQAAIALIIGYDRRAGKEAGVARSDTIMLVRADPQTKAISLMSFPRDLYVEVHCPGKPTFHSRINGAYAACGSKGTLATVKALTGLPVNYLITVDFHAFKEIVNHLHGVWIDVDRRYFNRNTGSSATNFANINLQPGYQRLDGGSALDFVRYRHTDSDFYRLARQQQFVKALKQQISSSLSPLDLPKVITAITSNVEVGQGGGGALSGKTVLSYALFAYELPGGHFFQTKIGNLGQDTSFDVLASQQSIDSAVQDFVNPNIQSTKDANRVALGKKIKTKAPPPQNVTVTVLNGNGVPGSAGNAAYELSQRGYRILTPTVPANAPVQTFYKTTVYFDPQQKGARAAAAQLQNLFAPAETLPLPLTMPPPLTAGAETVVVVGQTFHGAIAPAPVQHVLIHQRPNVTAYASLTEPLLRRAQRKVPFKLEVPTVIERSSTTDAELPLRVYTIQKHHKAVRLVFRTGSTEYWGVEETDWTDAPILRDRNFRHDLGGREFSLYYSGTHLHMVVLTANGTSYWVVNTLLDSLSNETMLAIAKGLKPLTKGR